MSAIFTRFDAASLEHFFKEKKLIKVEQEELNSRMKYRVIKLIFEGDRIITINEGLVPNIIIELPFDK